MWGKGNIALLRVHIFRCSFFDAVNMSAFSLHMCVHVCATGSGGHVICNYSAVSRMFLFIRPLGKSCSCRVLKDGTRLVINIF